MCEYVWRYSHNGYNMRDKQVHLWVIPGAAKNGQKSQNWIYTRIHCTVSLSILKCHWVPAFKTSKIKTDTSTRGQFDSMPRSISASPIRRIRPIRCQSCPGKSQWPVALWLLGRFQDEKLQSDAVLYSNCINSCRKGPQRYPLVPTIKRIISCESLDLHLQDGAVQL